MGGRTGLKTGMAAVVLAAAVAYSWSRGAPFGGFDFAQLWAGGQVVAEHGSRIYGEDGQSISNGFLAAQFERQKSSHLLNVIRERETLARSPSRQWLAAFVSTPFLFSLFAVLPENYDAAWLLYRALTFAATIAACVLLARITGMSLAAGMMMAAFALVLYQPLASDQRVGNTNQIQFLGIAAYLWLAGDERRRARVAGGLLLGLLIAFKPNVALVAPLAVAWLFLRGTRRDAMEHAGAIAGGVLAAVAVGSLWFGSFSAWSGWLSVAGRLGAANIERATGNIAVLRQPAVVTVLLLIVITAAMVAAPRGGSDDRDRFRIVASFGAVIYLLAANVVWLHYPVLAIPSLILLLSPRMPPPVRIAGAIAVLLAAITPLAFLVQWTDVSVQAHVVFVGLAILAATDVYVTSRAARQPLRRRQRGS